MRTAKRSKSSRSTVPRASNGRSSFRSTWAPNSDGARPFCPTAVTTTTLALGAGGCRPARLSRTAHRPLTTRTAQEEHERLLLRRPGTRGNRNADPADIGRCRAPTAGRTFWISGRTMFRKMGSSLVSCGVRLGAYPRAKGKTIMSTEVVRRPSKQWSPMRRDRIRWVRPSDVVTPIGLVEGCSAVDDSARHRPPAGLVTVGGPAGHPEARCCTS